MEMFESEWSSCKFSAMNDSRQTVSVSTESIASQLKHKLSGVDGDGSIITALELEDELMEVDNFLSEPKLDNMVDDNILGSESDNSEKSLKVEDFPCADELCQINTGTLNSDAKQEAEEESKFEFLEGVFRGVDEGENIHVTNDLSSDCADYLLDTAFSEEHSRLDYNPCQGQDMGNFCSTSLSPDISEREMCPVGISNLSTTIVPMPESNADQSTFLLDNMSIRELHEAFRSTFGRETSVKDKQWLKRRILFGLQNLIEVENGSSLVVSGLSHESEADLILISGNDYAASTHQILSNTHGNIITGLDKGVGTVGYVVDDVMASISGTEKIGFGGVTLGEGESALLNQKRLRKPTRRYIEESDVTSRACKLESSTASTTDKCSRARPHYRHYRKELETSPLVSRQFSVGGSGLQVSSGYKARRGRPRKNSTSLMGFDHKDYEENRMLSVQSRKYRGLQSSLSESNDDMSDDCVTTIRTEKGGIRRKHHRLWTLSEVMKLIEGVSQHGVGRWTDIKRLLFSSSGHRTSVDLKDKWRNLLRASCVQMQNRKEVEQRKKHASIPIPQNVLRRVRELAVIYPYPRERKPKPVRVATTPATGTGSDPSISRSGRILHRRNFA